MTERERESPKRRFSQKTADFRGFTPSLKNSSVWRPSETAEIFAGNCRLGSVTLGPSPSLSFLSLAVWISLVEFEQGISLVVWVFSLVFPGFQGVGGEGKSLVNLGVFLDKQTEQPRKGRTGFSSALEKGASESACPSTGCPGRCRKK